MLKLKVNASRGYDILFSRFDGIYPRDFLKSYGFKKTAVITDSNVDELYGEKLNDFLDGSGFFKYVIDAGEKSKNGENYLKIINWLAENGFQRHDAVIAFGGGVVGDLAGFVASTYMRGIRLISVPTTLLSMVDSSVGGKTAIDLPSGKNLCGTFYQPSAVLINTEFLNTLPEKEVSNGYGEVIKYALLDKRISAKMLAGNVDEKLIYHSLEIKRDIVEEDEFENGKRALLNLGHTVGHAIEKLSDYTLPHGECVVKGLKAALDVSANLFDLRKDVYENILKIIKSRGHDLSLIYSPEDIAGCIFSDKKSDGDEIRFVALKNVAETEIVSVKINLLENLLK